jgi:hypothetical protein
MRKICEGILIRLMSRKVMYSGKHTFQAVMMAAWVRLVVPQR